MAAHIFSESGQMQEVDIPDIFDVLEGGEDEGAVKYLLGFGGEDGTLVETTIVTQPGMEQGEGAMLSPASASQPG